MLVAVAAELKRAEEGEASRKAVEGEPLTNRWTGEAGRVWRSQTLELTPSKGRCHEDRLVHLHFHNSLVHCRVLRSTAAVLDLEMTALSVQSVDSKGRNPSAELEIENRISLDRCSHSQFHPSPLYSHSVHILSPAAHLHSSLSPIVALSDPHNSVLHPSRSRHSDRTTPDPLAENTSRPPHELSVPVHREQNVVRHLYPCSLRLRQLASPTQSLLVPLSSGTWAGERGASVGAREGGK